MAGVLKKGRDYLEYFNPEVYLKLHYSDLQNEGGLMDFIFKAYHEIFKSGNVCGNRLLDIGTGPIPHSVISATPYVKEIYMSDYTPANRQYMYQWLQGTGQQTFSDVFEFITTLENKGEIWSKRSDEVRSKVVGLFPVDLLQENMFGDVLFPKFDIITSSFCIECVVGNYKEWTTSCLKISNLLTVGGHLIINGVLGENFYSMGENNFFCYNLQKDEFVRHWEKAGFEVISWQELKPAKLQLSDFETAFAMHCVKK